MAGSSAIRDKKFTYQKDKIKGYRLMVLEQIFIALAT